jgi:polyhydroxyalkanoate synthesis regulator phasin
MAADARRRTEDARRYLEGVLGNLTPSGARDLARSMVEQAQEFAGQGPAAMANQVREMGQQMMDWSQQGRSQLMEVVQREIRKQLKALGLATTDDVDALRKRVRELEKAAAGPAKRPTAKRSAPKKRTTTVRSVSRTGSRSSGSEGTGTRDEAGGSGSGGSGSGGSGGSSGSGGSGGSSGSGGSGPDPGGDGS